MDAVYLIVLTPATSARGYNHVMPNERVVILIALSRDAAIAYLESDSKLKKQDNDDVWKSDESGATLTIVEKRANMLLPAAGLNLAQIFV